MTWNQFKPQLFELIEQRRSSFSGFGIDKIYALILGCSHRFSAQRVTEAANAMARIKNDGTFLLVADSASEFAAVLDAAAGEAEQPGNPTSKSDQDTQAVAAGLPPRTQSMSNPALENARRGSGEPFRP